MNSSNKDSINYMVCVRCMTYNHAPYIVDAMNGFCMQQTDFPFVCTIIDDASTDGEQEVIHNYLQENFDLKDDSITRNEETEDYIYCYVRHKTNHNCFFAVYFLKYNHYSIKKPKAPYIKEWTQTVKYIAICEGDDYWTKSNKLQKQADFLNKHDDFIMCSHNFKTYIQNTGTFENRLKYEANELNFELIDDNYIFIYHINNYFSGWFTQPLSCMYRNVEPSSIIPKGKYKYTIDLVFFYYLIRKGKGALFNEVMGVYRKHSGGINAGEIRSVTVNKELELLYRIYEIENDERALIGVDHRVIENICNYRFNGEYSILLKCIKTCYSHVPLSVFFRILSKLANYYTKKIFIF